LTFFFFQPFYPPASSSKNCWASSHGRLDWMCSGMALPLMPYSWSIGTCTSTPGITTTIIRPSLEHWCLVTVPLVNPWKCKNNPRLPSPKSPFLSSIKYIIICITVPHVAGFQKFSWSTCSPYLMY
jgi:hypothetical protein